MRQGARRLPRNPPPRVLRTRGGVAWTPSSVVGAPWWRSADVTGQGPFAPVATAIQQNPTAVPFVSPLLASAGGPLLVPIAGFFAGKPALLSSADNGLYTTQSFAQPASWWCVVAFGGAGWSFDSSVSYTGLRIDATGEAYVINSNAFSFGVLSNWTPALGYAASYLMSVHFDGVNTRLYVGTTLMMLAAGLIDTPALDQCIFGPFPGSPPIDSAWAAGGFVPGGDTMPDLALRHAWAQAEYGVT